jgi:2-oxoglutarate dehydrogenase E2 component (dihydrolipoamide succinyltransferase)
MRIEVTVPNLPESVSDATLANWHRQPGEPVQKSENLVDLETDKVVLEVPVPETGILREVRRGQGDVVRSGDLLAVIETEALPAVAPAEAEPAPAEEPAPPAPARVAEPEPGAAPTPPPPGARGGGPRRPPPPPRRGGSNTRSP